MAKRVVAQRDRTNDRAHRMRMDALSTPSTFWEAVRGRFPAAVAELADQARYALTLRDLRALEAAELVEVEAHMAAAPNLKTRAVLRAVAKQCRRNLGMLVIAENPTLDLNKQLVPMPIGMMVDRGYPEAERTARRADRRAAIEIQKIALLDRIMAGTEPHTNYMDKLHRSPREELLRLRDEATRARLAAEDKARAARAELERQRAAGAVVYSMDQEDAAAVMFGDVDGDGNELADDMAAELRDDFADDDGQDDPFADL